MAALERHTRHHIQDVEREVNKFSVKASMLDKLLKKNTAK